MQHLEGQTTEELIARLQSQFENGNQTADVHAFLGRLAEKGLLRDAADL